MPDEKAQVRLSVMVPDDLMARLHLEAARRRMSIAATLRAIVDDVLPPQPPGLT